MFLFNTESARNYDTEYENEQSPNQPQEVEENNLKKFYVGV